MLTLALKHSILLQLQSVTNHISLYKVTDLLILEGVCSHHSVIVLTHYHQPVPPARSTGPVQFHHILSGIFLLYPVILQLYKFIVSFFQLISYFTVTSCHSWQNDPSKQTFPSLVTQWRTFFTSLNLAYIYIINDPHFGV